LNDHRKHVNLTSSSKTISSDSIFQEEEFLSHARSWRHGEKGKKVKLSDFRGKHNVVLAFYPLAWTPV